MLSYPHTDKLFEGAAPPSAWFYTFEENRNVAVQDLLLGAADLGPFGTLDPWAVALQWLQGFSDTEFPKKFDAALAEWIANSWGEPVHPASYGSAVLTARAWESASLIIANFDRLPVSANILRDRVLGNREFLSFMGEGPSRDPAGRAWQVLAQYQEDDSLFEEWNLILKLGPGVPWHHGQYGLMGLDLLPGHRRGAGIPPSLAFGLRSFGHALLKRLSDGYLNEDNARREFERLSRWAQRRYPFKSAWRSVWRQMITSEYDRLAPWVSESLGSDDPLLGRAEKELVKLPTARQDWLSRVQLLRNQLKRRPTAAILSAAHTLLSEEEEYYRATGDSYSFVRTACNFASVLPERWLASGIPWLEMAARFDSSNPYPVTQLATALTRSGNLLRAEQVARRGVYQFPLDVFAFGALGEVLRTAGKLDEAESVYRETVRRFPDNVFARNGLGEVLKAAGKLDEAESVYREAVRRFPDHEGARNGLSEVLKAVGKLDEAESVYRETVRSFPNHFVSRNGLGEILKAVGKLDEAESVYRETVRSFPNDVVSRTGFGEVLKAVGKLDEAESVYRETVRRFPDNVFARNGFGEILKAAGKLDEAESVYRETVHRFPHNVVSRTGFGEVLKAASKLDEAESVYRETVRRFPNDVPARNGLAGVLKALGKLEEAKSVYRDILDRFPKDVYAKKGLDSIDRLKPGSEEIDAPDFEWGFIPEFDGDLIPELDLEFVPELDDELTVQSGPPTDEPPQPQLEDSSQIRSLDVDRGSPEEPAPPALDLPASRPSGEGPAFLRPSDIDILIQDSHLLRKWARGTGELAMSHLREEARSLLGKLERFLRSSPSAVLESSLLLIETQNIQSALQLLDEAGARYPDSKRVQYASARTRREAARQARQEGHPFTFDSPSATDIPIAWTKLLRLEPVLLPTVRLGLVRSLPYLTDGLRLRKAQHSALGQLGFALHSLQPAKETKDPRSYWAYRVGELLLGDRAAEVRGASEVLDHDIDVASQNNEKHLLTLNGLEEDLLLHYHLL